jgi:hypothetical protein
MFLPKFTMAMHGDENDQVFKIRGENDPIRGYSTGKKQMTDSKKREI